MMGLLIHIPHSLNPDADPVTKKPGNGFETDMLERGLSEAIKTDLLFGELELVAERTALHHLKKAGRVSVLHMVKQHLAGEALSLIHI